MRNLLLVLIVMFAGCEQSPLVRSTGKYQSPNGEWTVTVSGRSKSLIDYAITDAKTGTELAQAGGFSDAMRWFLFWDEDSRLWVYDSDMGGFGFWAHSSDAGFEFTDLSPDDDLSNIPPIVTENLPSTIKRLFNLEQRERRITK